MSIRVLIADDHAVVRRGLKQIVGEDRGMKVVAEAQDARELLALLRKHPCDAVVLDMGPEGEPLGGLVAGCISVQVPASRSSAQKGRSIQWLPRSDIVPPPKSHQRYHFGPGT